VLVTLAQVTQTTSPIGKLLAFWTLLARPDAKCYELPCEYMPSPLYIV